MAENTNGGFRIVPRGKGSTIWRGSRMRAPYGLEIIENCITSSHSEDRLFCNLAPAAVQGLSAITSTFSFPKGTKLFGEEQAPRGVYILSNGRVKLSTSSTDGKTLIVKIAEPGEVLGLSATVTGRLYELTADVIEPTRVNFISRTDFLTFLRQHGETALRVAQQLGETYHAAIAEMRSIGLSFSAGEKLARFLLDWCASNGNGKGEIRAKLTLTHEEIAEIIGTSRETVTRLLADFKKKQFLQITGRALILQNKAALENLLNSQH